MAPRPAPAEEPRHQARRAHGCGWSLWIYMPPLLGSNTTCACLHASLPGPVWERLLLHLHTRGASVASRDGNMVGTTPTCSFPWSETCRAMARTGAACFLPLAWMMTRGESLGARKRRRRRTTTCWPCWIGLGRQDWVASRSCHGVLGWVGTGFTDTACLTCAYSWLKGRELGMVV